MRGEQSGLQIVVLIDGSARSGLSLQYKDLQSFVKTLPEGAQVGVAYMQNGRAVMAQNITPDHNLAASAFRLTTGIPGGSASPYFCLSDLVKNWPSGNTTTDRREVLMITDGVDLYYGRSYDPTTPTCSCNQRRPEGGHHRALDLLSGTRAASTTANGPRPALKTICSSSPRAPGAAPTGRASAIPSRSRRSSTTCRLG